MISYVIETLVFQIGFLLLYEMVFKGSTYFQWNRMYLLVAIVFSLGLPLLQVGNLGEIIQIGPTTSDWLPTVQTLEGVVLSGTSELGMAQKWIQWLWLTGIAVSVILFAYRLIRIWNLVNTGHRVLHKEFTLVWISNSYEAFSFFTYVVIGENHDNKTREIILSHEKAHVSRKHTLDLLLIELVKIVFWFNPLIWLVEKHLKELHEFQADATAAQESKQDYCLGLVEQVFQNKAIPLTHSFFKKSQIKKRIVMIQKRPTKRISLINFILIIPLCIGILLYTSCESDSQNPNPELKSEGSTSVDRSVKTLSEIREDLNKAAISEESKEKIAEVLDDIEKNGKVMETRSSDVNRVPFSSIDEVPTFPGCEESTDKRACFNDRIITHIKKNFNYPEEAIENGIEGKVSIMFLVDKAGKVTNIMTNGPHPILEEEARRIMERLPDMKPGKQNQQFVEVPYSIPITFQL